MNIDAIQSGARDPYSQVSSSQLRQEDFFTLLTTQLRSQNPLEPMGDQEFMAELAQFANLEQTSRINDNLLGLAYQQESLAMMDQMTRGAQLIGLNVEFLDGESGDLTYGRVEAVRIDETGVVLDLGDRSIPMNSITAVVEKVPEGDDDIDEESTQEEAA